MNRHDAHRAYAVLVPSCKNATETIEPALDRSAATKGVLSPVETARVANLRRDYPVAEGLRPFVERYWSVRWDRTDQSAFRSEVLSHPSVNLSVESGSHPRFGFAMPALLVHAPVTRRFCIDLLGTGRVTAVKFRPGGFAAFTGLRPARDTVTRFAGMRGVAPQTLVAAVLGTPDEADRARVLDSALAPLAPEPNASYLELLELIDDMIEDRSLVRVEQVAARGAMNVRTLQRLFACYIGVTPKAVLARFRLQDAAAAIDTGQFHSLADLACSLGWFDQAHFSRDFHAAIGLTPTAYLNRAHCGTSTGRRASSRGPGGVEPRNG